MLIEKRASLHVVDMVKITPENIQEVAKWCGGVVENHYIILSNHDQVIQCFYDEYILKEYSGFWSYSESEVNMLFDRNEKGELIEN